MASIQTDENLSQNLETEKPSNKPVIFSAASFTLPDVTGKVSVREVE